MDYFRMPYLGIYHSATLNFEERFNINIICILHCSILHQMILALQTTNFYKPPPCDEIKKSKRKMILNQDH